MKIAHFGTFDVDNYGDLLFPHVAQWRWPDEDWIHVSPLGNPTRFEDSLPTVGVKQACDMTFDAVMVGGGNIVNPGKTSLPDYGEVEGTAYPSLWLGAAVLAAKQEVPLVFNGPGIGPHDFHLLQKRLAIAVFSSAEYLAFRERESAAIATRLSRRRSAVTIPDTAFDLPNMWPAVQGPTGGNRHYVAVHVNSRYQTSVESTARSLDLITKRLKAPVRLLSIGPCHGDIELSHRVAERMRADHSVGRVISIRAMAEVIAGASLYIGSSMHGFITALSYGVPGLLVLNRRPMRKFTGLLEIADIPSRAICESWEDVPESVGDEVLLPAERLERLHRSLDRHWGDMREAVCSGAPCMLPRWAFPWKRLVYLSRCIDRGVGKLPGSVRRMFSGE